MKCAYCGKEAKGTKEHIISCAILDLFPECYLTYDKGRNSIYPTDPMIKDVCAECNNQKISYVDNYARNFISRYFVQKYTENDIVEIEYDYVMIQKMLLKYAFNDMRSHKDNYTFFDEEMRHYLINESDKLPKANVTIFCGLAVNVSPVPDMIFGNQKIRWFKDPILYADSLIQNIDCETGEISFNDNVPEQKFADLIFSYLFRFNSIQFLLMCWDRDSKDIEQNKALLCSQYSYRLMDPNKSKMFLSICTDEVNYHQFEQIHVKWDGIFEIELLRKFANKEQYQYKEIIQKEWEKAEENIKREHPR